MLTIKDVKSYRGLDQKATIKEAETIGRNSSEATVYGHIVGLALAAGQNAKAEGLKSYTFDRAFEVFAENYYVGSNAKTEGTLKAYRSAFNTWTRAGMNAAWDATDVAIRCFNERSKGDKQLSLTQRSGMLSKLLKLDHVPTAKEYADAKPKAGNETGGATLKGSAAALQRSVEGFGVKWLDKLSPTASTMYAQLHKMAGDFARHIEAEAGAAPKPTAKGKPSEPTMADKRRELAAKLASLTAAEKPRGTKTIQ